MRSWKCLVAIAVSCLAACAQMEGQCWIDDRGNPGGPGAGGGPIVAGGGSYGDDQPPAPTPQDGSDGRLYFDCNVDGPCDNKCLDVFVAAADECSKIQDEDQRKTCQHAAYVQYMTCRQACKDADKKACVAMFDACQDKGYPCTRKIQPKMTLCALCLDDCIADRPYKYSECYQCGFK